eukprot:2872003-Amphidinium_carterae.1
MTETASTSAGKAIMLSSPHASTVWSTSDACTNTKGDAEDEDDVIPPLEKVRNPLIDEME